MYEAALNDIFNFTKGMTEKSISINKLSKNLSTKPPKIMTMVEINEVLAKLL